MDEPNRPPAGDSDPPRGSPYGEPPWFAAEAYRGTSWTDRLRYHAFPIAVAIVVIGFGALFYFAPHPGAEVRSPMPAEPPPAAEAEERGAIGTGTATLTVVSQPSAATVRIDGDSIGTTPLEDYAMSSGVYIVNVQKPGYFDRDTILVLRADQSQRYAPELRPSGAPEASSSSSSDEGLPGQVRGPDVPNGAGPDASASADPASADPASADPASADPASAEGTEDRATPPSSDAVNAEAASASPPDTPSAPPSTGRLVVQSEPAGSGVQLNGDSVGTTPLDLGAVAAGSYQLRIAQAGYEPVTRSVAIRPDAPARVSAALTPRPGRLRVLVQPWGSIYVDSALQVRDSDVWYEVELAPGRYTVRATHPALGEEARTVELAPGGTQEVVFDLRDG